MKNIIFLLALACVFTSCNVTESIVFNSDNSGEYLVKYQMGDAMQAFNDAMGGDNSNDENKEKGEVMDTTMVFADIMATYKDSIASLPEKKQLAMEAVRNMFMNMKLDEDAGIMDIGIGMKFESIEDLKNIQDKIKKVQSLNQQGDQLEAMKSGSPLGKFMGTDDSTVRYDLTTDGFSRTTMVSVTEESEEVMEELFDETDEGDKEFIKYFEESYYNVKLTFPKAVKSVSFEGAEISADRKTVSYRANWLDFIKNPKLLDVNVEFVDE
ncbi:hypothetical protein [Winogradskyella ursingii]|uniref:hypothetical protein n=1 Tax=Winogradskyella ursingii TaxID=2686079 RepID=UPI0015CEE705|nr:hypothetical protein [Winogradskyella ursingii]